MSITLVGVSSGTNTATPVAHQVGDIIVFEAFNGTSTTIPTLPAGYQTPTNGTKAGTTCAGRLGFKIATATNDAGGTWTNATSVVCSVYRTGNFANGSSLFLGPVANSASTTNTVNYPALTLTHTDGTSWVLGFAGCRGNTETLTTAPSGMTNNNSETNSTTSQAASFDTNGAVSSWASTNATTTGTAGNSVSFTAELIENQAGTAINNIVQHISYNYDAPVADNVVGNNYIFTKPGEGSLAGNGLVLAMSWPIGVSVSSITDNAGNTWSTTPIATLTGGTLQFGIFQLTSALTGTQTITVSFSAATNPIKAWLTEVYNITGTLNGTASAATVNASGIISAGSFTPTNNNSNGGNLILCYTMEDATSGATNPSLILPESNFALNDADISQTSGQGIPNASQFYLQATSAAITPQFYLSAGGTDTYNVIAIALSVGVQGTPKTSAKQPHIDRMCYFGDTGTVTSWKLQLPSTGNLGFLISFFSSIASPTWTATADGDGTSWTLPTGLAGAPTCFYYPNQPAHSSRTATLTLGSASTPRQMIYMDISGADPSPFDKIAVNTSAVLNNLNSFTPAPTITPAQPNELIIAFQQLGLGPSTGSFSSPSGAIFGLPTYDGAQFTATITGTSMSVTAFAFGSGNLGVNDLVRGSGVTAGTTITSIGSTGGATGTYTIQPSQTVSSATTMYQEGTDSNTMSYGNGFGIYYNGASTAAITFSLNIANQASNSGTATAIAFKAAATTIAPVGGSAGLFAPLLGPINKFGIHRFVGPALAYAAAVKQPAPQSGLSAPLFFPRAQNFPSNRMLLKPSLAYAAPLIPLPIQIGISAPLFPGPPGFGPIGLRKLKPQLAYPSLAALFSVIADSGAPIELLSGMTSDALALLEMTAGARVDQLMQAEFITAAVQDNPVLLEVISGLRADVLSQLEVLASAQANNLMPIEIIAAFRSDIAVLLETVSGQRSDMVIASEILAGLRSDLLAPLEIAGGLRSDSAVPIENQGTIGVTGDGAVQIESTSAFRSDAGTLQEILAALRADAPPPAEIVSGVSGQGAVQLEWATAFLGQAGVAIDVIVSLRADVTLSLEDVGAVRADAMAGLEVISAAVFGSLSPMENVAAARSDIAIQLENTGGLQITTNAAAPLEFGGVTGSLTTTFNHYFFNISFGRLSG